jgi:NADH-quinone oxidoreductase subunit E
MTTQETERDEIRRETEKALKRVARNKANLIPALQKVQEALGYLPDEAMRLVAGHLGITPMEVYSVVTFYNRFRLNPPGRHSIRVCLGTACHMKGGAITLDAWKRRLGIDLRETTEDREFELDAAACVGCCFMAPVTVVDGTPYGQVDPIKVDDILRAFEHERDAARKGTA